MPKKISLNEIKVQSFVTALDIGAKGNIRGVKTDPPVVFTYNGTTCPTIQGDSDFACPCGFCKD
jgi:hypothetical protein